MYYNKKQTQKVNPNRLLRHPAWKRSGSILNGKISKGRNKQGKDLAGKRLLRTTDVPPDCLTLRHRTHSVYTALQHGRATSANKMLAIDQIVNVLS